MGNQLAGIAPLQIFPVEYYVSDLPDVAYDASLGSTRFFKVARAVCREGLAVVKVFAINDPSLPLKYHRDCVEELKERLNSATNCLPFQKCMLTDKAGILIRQFVKDNLYDRISTRPFLNNIEKKWIAFQLLQALNQCENANVCHGDIKLENIMVTSWNWVFLTDFASYKPTYLPEDNPADFSYFFDTSRRRICYIAPERFVTTLNSETLNASISGLVLPDEEVKKGDLALSMDVFSLGCALTELFTEGHAPFDFSQLLAYRSGEYTPWKTLEKIDDSNIRDLVHSMMEKDSTKRSKPSVYLEQQRNKAFPEYFYSVLERYLRTFAKFPILCPDERVHRLKKDIKYLVEAITKSEELYMLESADESYFSNYSEGLVIVASFLTSCLRALKHCTAKLNALDVLLDLQQYLSPDIILDRLLPSMIYLIKDPDPKVRVSVIETLSECLAQIKHIPQSGSNIFPEYVLPNLLHIANDDAVIVRMAFAEKIAYLAETALRFLEATQINAEQDAARSSISEIRYSHYHVSYDQELKTLQELIQQCVSVLLSDSANCVKQILLEKGITRLCVFFGRQKSNDVLLSHMITYLNDKEDSNLRGAFFDAVVGVAKYIGWQCYPILKPLLQQGLSDSEEFVIVKALNALIHLTEMGLIQKQMLYELVSESSPLLLHPNLWIRQGSVGFVCAVARCLSLADIQCHLIPRLQPFLKQEVVQVNSELVMLNSIQSALPRSIFDFLVKSPSVGLFLDSLCDRRFIQGISKPSQTVYKDQDATIKTMYRRLSSDGMTELVEDQIVAMRDYLLKVNVKKSMSDAHMNSNSNGDVIDLRKIEVSPKVHPFSLTNDNQSYRKIFKSMRPLKKNVGSQESPNATMNEEWQHMFGASDGKSPSIQKPQASSESFAGITESGQTSRGSNLTDSSEITAMENVPNEPVSPTLISFQEQFYISSLCTPCQKELHSLIEKKQDEWVRDQILNESSANSLKEERAGRPFKPPCGFLIAHLHEHKRSVNKVQPIPNTALFATCSNDGTVKLWDCEKMEGKNIANRSRLTYSRLEGPVSSLTTCQNMQSLAAASDNGNIHVFRIANDITKPAILQTRVLDPQEEGCAVDLTYFDIGSQSILTYATLYGSIVGWDLRSPGTAWKLENHPRQGLVTSFCVHYNHCWLVLGTASGKIICWDLRFQLPISTISHPTGSRIHSLLLHPKHQSAVLSSFKGNNEVSMWDIETQARIMTLWASSTPPLSQTQASEHSINSMCWLPSSSETALLTGGSDMRIRYWNIDCPTESTVVSSAMNDAVCPGVVNYRSRLIDGTNVIQETFTRSRSRASYDPPKRYPEVPQPGHCDSISGLSVVQSSQLLTISASRNGVIKVWK